MYQELIQDRLNNDKGSQGHLKSSTQILLAYRGSMAHGMYIPNSDPNSIDDIDLMGVVVPSNELLHGLYEFGSSETMEIKQAEWDIVFYSLRKTLNLLGKGNPNVLSLLWVEDEHILAETDAGRLLRSHRHIFLSKKIYPAFQGYAYSQLKKMIPGIDGKVIYEGYMGAKRKALVDKYGYDCKNAAHLIRLLKMGIEALEYGELHVDRSNIDREELLDIKRGLWSLVEVQTFASKLFAIMEAKKDKTSLPEHVDWKLINRLCIDLTEMTNA